MEDINKRSIYIGFWKRVGAKILDLLILSPLIILYMMSYRGFLQSKFALPSILYFIFVSLYQIFFNVKFRGTPGKLIMKINIINADHNRITILQALIRYSLFIVSSFIYIIIYYYLSEGTLFYVLKIFYNIIPFITMADVLVIPFNRQKRAIHDYLAGTYVVYKDSICRRD